MIIPVAKSTRMIIPVTGMIIPVEANHPSHFPRGTRGVIFFLACGPSHRDETRMFLGQGLLLG